MTKPGNSGSDEPKQETPATVAETESAATPEQPDSAAVEDKSDTAGEEKAAAKPAKPKPASAKPVTAKPKTRARAKVDPDEPIMPTAREAAARAQAKRRFEERAPLTLRLSLYFFVASGVVWLISTIAAVVLKQTIIDDEIKRSKSPDLTPDQIASGITQILWILLVASVTFTVFLALFGYKATEGTRRARTLVTIVSTIMVLFHLLLNGTIPGILSAFLGLVALALLWSPPARAYFPPREPRR